MNELNIAFIGVGIMGQGIVRNLKKEKFKLNLYARNFQKIKDLEDENTKVHNNVNDAILNSNIIILCLTEDQTIKEIIYKNKILENFEGILLDFGTTSPELTLEISEFAKERNIHFIDSPMTGSKVAAQTGELIFMVGCDDETAFEKCSPIWQVTGKKVIRCGKIGDGQKTKISLNMVQAGILQVYLEGLMLSRKLGIPEEIYMETIENSAAKSGISEFKLKSSLKKDFETHFSLKNMNKDLNHAINLCIKNNVQLPLSFPLKNIFNAGMNDNLGEFDFCSLIQINEKYN